MADVRNDQYLHRPTAGRGAITAQDPLEVLLHSGGQPISGTNRLPVEAILTGSTVEEVNGAEAVRVKQTALAYHSWDFDGQDVIEVTAGSTVFEESTVPVNGFGTLAAMVRCIERSAKWWLRARWSSNSSGSASRSAYETIIDAREETAQTGTGVIPTKSQYVRGAITNNDNEDLTFHVHFLLRI